MFDNPRKWLARLIAPSKKQKEKSERAAPKKRGKGAPHAVTRMYHTARSSRLTSGWATSTTSADSELMTSLVALRNRSRALIRDAAYAKRAKIIVQNNVIGPGVGMQARVMSSRDKLRTEVNDSIEAAWEEWTRAENCHTGGRLHFSDFERALFGQIFEAGEVFVRKHPVRAGSSEVPLTLELIEAERIADEFMNPVPPGAVAPGAVVKMGIEVDRFNRPVAYWIRQRHPGELRVSAYETDRIERVPAEQVFHLALIDRWPQTRGEPWLHAVARKLNDMDGYVEAEIVAARGAASYMATIETTDAFPGEETTGTAEGAKPEVTLEPGTAQKLDPGQKFNFVSPNRPNSALDPFMRYMLREIAAGVGVSYESLSRDYSQSNYSSSRLALLDDRDLWRMLQQWWLRAFRLPLHREWLGVAVLAKAVPHIKLEEFASAPEKFAAVLFKPRGWSWIDPEKEVAAQKDALIAGFTTQSDIIAMSGDGRDLEDVLQQRKREIELAKELGLTFETSPEVYTADSKKALAQGKASTDAAKQPKPAPGAAAEDDKGEEDETPPQGRVVNLKR